MRRPLILLACLLWSVSLGAQTNGGAGTTLPASCVQGSIYTHTTNNQVYVCVSTNTWSTPSDSILGVAKSVNLNSVADTAITISAAKYIVRRVTVTNCSATPVLAQIAVYSATGAGGTNIVAAVVLTSLAAPTTLVDLTIVPTTTAFTAATLYARNMVAQGSGLTCDVYLTGDVLP